MLIKKKHFIVKTIFLFATVFLLVLSFMSYFRYKNLIDESEFVNHSHKVKSQLNKIFSILEGVESSQGRYLLTKDSVFLSVVFTAKTNLELHLNNFAALTKDNPSQQQNVSELRTLVLKRVNYLQKVLEDSQSLTIDKQRLLTGKELMDAVSKQITLMENEEDKFLKIRSASLNKSATLTPLFAILLIVFSLLIIIGAYFKIIQELKISDTLKSNVLEGQNRLQTIFEAAPDAVIIIDHKGIITNWNVEAENIFGWEKSEAIGKTLTETIIPERYRELHSKGLKQFLKTGEGRVLNKPIEIHALKRDNSEIPIELKISASKTNGQQPVFIGFVRDISQRRQSEEALKNKTQELLESNEELLKSNKELESFNYISSHDLQEPLRQIQNFSSRINDTEQQNLTDKGKIYLDKINNAASRMRTLIADLLTYSRTKTEERKFEITDLRQIVTDVTAEFKETIDEKNATIELNEMCDANVIPFQFRQLMHNIIGNALKFSNPDIPPRIKISSRNLTHSKLNDTNLSIGKKYCHISITDNGIGFEPQYKARIFEVFQRLHDRQKITGTGIGLAIVKKIVENHNGIITATSELNEGATFDIYIPAT